MKNPIPQPRTNRQRFADHNTKQRQAEIRQFRKRTGLAAGVIWWGAGGVLFLMLCILSAAVA